jgi:hypothetical protein
VIKPKLNAPKVYAFDIECYSNYFLAVFATQDNSDRFVISMLNDEIRGGTRDQVAALVHSNHMISFNGMNYDWIILSAFAQGGTNADLKRLNDLIITDGMKPWEICNKVPALQILEQADGIKHIDLVGATPLIASLKTYGCRIHAPRLQDLPIAPDSHINALEAHLLASYCDNDVDVTWRIFDEVKDSLKLREKISHRYEIDLLSKSDPQIAEALLRHYLTEAGVYVSKPSAPPKPFKYNIPSFIRFNSPELKTVLDTVGRCTFHVKDTGNVELPNQLKTVIEFAGAKYKLGIGGLHSQEKKQAIIPAEDEILGEYDVASMYPAIILGQGLYPKHLGKAFVDVYRNIFNTRMEAKREMARVKKEIKVIETREQLEKRLAELKTELASHKLQSDTLKLQLNSSFGKFGSKYSYLYSPELLIQTTVSGQLALLMLIERVTAAGARVVSANTDGINVLMKRDQKADIDALCAVWTMATTYELEWTEYTATYNESVNSYIAFTPAGHVKTKGTYEGGSIGKGYSAQICNEAVIAFLQRGIPVEKTINACRDIKKFLVMRGVRDGGIWKGKKLGRVVRWYYGKEGEPIVSARSGNKTATSDGAVPMMDLEENLPTDLDYEKYIQIAKKKLKALGV